MSTRELRFHLEWQTYPTWTRSASGGSDNPDPRDLGIPDDLAEEIVAFSDEYDALWDSEDPGRGPQFADAAARQHFYDRGRGLAQRLSDAVGSRWQVLHQGADGAYSPMAPSVGD